nr:hypothetical protein [Tanacetum cinerariifolium]
MRHLNDYCIHKLKLMKLFNEIQAKHSENIHGEVKQILLAFVFLLILHHHHADAVVTDTDFEGTQSSRKLIQGRQQEALIPKRQRKLRTVPSPPAPKANRF